MGITQRDVSPETWAKLTGQGDKPLRASQRPVALAAPALSLNVTLPLVTRSEVNLRNWKARSRRTQAARREWLVMLGMPVGVFPSLEVRAIHVRLTRLGGRSLDDDNLRSALKATRDVVAEWCHRDDADPVFRWRYDQKPGGPYGVRVVLAIHAEGADRA